VSRNLLILFSGSLPVLVDKLSYLGMDRRFFHSLRFELFFVLLIGILFSVALAVGFPALDQLTAPTTTNSLAGAVTCVLGMALPLLGICAILIKLDSAGPACFRQRRMGFRGKIFQVVKLRTMAVSLDGENRKESATQANDARITRIGRFLRKSRLDELPQIFNIILGQMSWIGPRPEAVSLSDWYDSEIPFYRYRHIVRPGITGWAQINQGHVASLDEINGKLQYDFYYIKHLSYWLDIIIALRTLRVVLSGFGAK
jgi:lipopolysaccharide/colanic/teichoic acid biosynthesis glycosyltransferase